VQGSFSAAAIAAIAVIAAYSGGARAQGGPPMITDDPGTPGNGHWEINLATLSDFMSNLREYELPLIDLNYGLGDSLQLKYEVPFVLQDESGDSRSGLGNSLIGVKWRFHDARPDAWRVSTYPQVLFNNPNSAAPRRGLAAAGTSIFLPVEFAKSYPGFDVDFELGRWVRPGARADSWTAGVVVAHHIRGPVEIMAEVHEEGSINFARNEPVVNLGMRWDQSARFTLLAAIGRDLHNGFGVPNTLLTYLGIQLHL
jgi:hypothetical protein